MDSTELATTAPQTENVKVAYALNLCAASISQIIESKDIVVLKQEREHILNNLNLQNFVKHPALFDILKRILDTITYLEIQAGDLSFIEKEYQHKLKNAIWSAIPSPGALLAGGNPVSIAIAVAAQIGTGYMNYRRNKSQYSIDKERSEWELKRHELEQLYGLRAQLFETAWKLSSDYDFHDRFRLSQTQLTRYSEALFENDPLRRFERLDVMSDKFDAFPPFWYYKGNAAMQVFRNAEQYGSFARAYKDKSLEAYNKFHNGHFEFLREDIIAASCCLEHISLLEPDNELVKLLLQKSLKFAGENYDVLQQSIYVNLQLNNFDAIIAPLREMIANDYNVELNALLLYGIYINNGDKTGYAILRAIAPLATPWWADDAESTATLFVNAKKLADAFEKLVERVLDTIRNEKKEELREENQKSFLGVVNTLEEHAKQNETIKSVLQHMCGQVNIVEAQNLKSSSRKVADALRTGNFRIEGTEIFTIIDQVNCACKGKFLALLGLV
jgi:hypothetical protein